MPTFPIQPLPHQPRNVIYTALFNLLKQCPSPTGMPWQKFSQYFLQWDQVPPGSQPACFLVRGPESAEQKHAHGVTKWLLRSHVWIYYRTEDYRTGDGQTRYPDQLADQFKDNFERLFLSPLEQTTFTLGGVCFHCWIDGAIITDPGLDGDPQAVILIPISIEI